jgi:hypothetical protein
MANSPDTPGPVPTVIARTELSRGDARVFLEQWKTIIDVQKHFNEIILRMRTTGVSVVIAVYGAAALSMSQFPSKSFLLCGYKHWLCAYRFHPSAAILFFGLLLLGSIYAMDRWYYYQLLLSAVDAGNKLDRDVGERNFAGTHLLGLTKQISDRVSLKHANRILTLFYFLPFFAGALALLYVLCFYGAP